MSEPSWISVEGTVMRGHGVASGVGVDPRYPKGTLALQLPCFEEAGLDLGRFHRATINVSIAPRAYKVIAPLATIRGVRWSREVPAEDFSFFTCRFSLSGAAEPPVDGLIYYPHPETKPEHFQDPSVLEVMAPWIDGVAYGDAVTLDLNPAEIAIR